MKDSACAFFHNAVLAHLNRLTTNSAYSKLHVLVVVCELFTAGFACSTTGTHTKVRTQVRWHGVAAKNGA